MIMNRLFYLNKQSAINISLRLNSNGDHLFNHSFLNVDPTTKQFVVIKTSLDYNSFDFHLIISLYY